MSISVSVSMSDCICLCVSLCSCLCLSLSLSMCQSVSVSVSASYLSIHKSSQWQIVKQIREVFPDVCVPILSQTFVVETVDLSNLSTLVVSTKYCHSIFKSHLNNQSKISFYRK